MDAWVDGWMDGWMDCWTDGWMDGWIVGLMDGWMDKIYFLLSRVRKKWFVFLGRRLTTSVQSISRLHGKTL